MASSAHICHCTPYRLRIKVPSRRNQVEYFSNLKDQFSQYDAFEEIQVNAKTAGILLVGDRIDLNGIEEYAKANDLFTLESHANSVPASHRLVQPFESFDRSLQAITKGNLDLISLVFYGLLGSGIYQIAKGNISAPPWHTAFWYAFGLFTAHLARKPIKPTDTDERR